MSDENSPQHHGQHAAQPENMPGAQSAEDLAAIERRRRDAEEKLAKYQEEAYRRAHGESDEESGE